MSFEFIEKKFQKSIEKIKNKSSLKKEKVEEFLKEVKFSLIEADVSIKVVNEFLNSIRKRSEQEYLDIGETTSKKLLSIVNEELIKILGSKQRKWKKTSRDVVVFVGIQGSGKTTSIAKISNYLVNTKKYYKKPLVIGLDVYRPGAIDQLENLVSKKLNFDFFSIKNTKNVKKILTEGVNLSIKNGNDLILIDTAGRLQTNNELMEEIKMVKKISNPKETIFVSDAMAGQEMLNIASEFHKEVKLTSVMITKLDSNAKGGSSLSLSYSLNIPVNFVGVGEKIKDIEEFIPKRIASRILGFGDIETLTEKVQEVGDVNNSERIFRKILSGNFNLDDLVISMEELGKIGNMKGLLKFLPGSKLNSVDSTMADKRIEIYKVLISSMTAKEKRNPKLLKHPSRKNRIIEGSGRTNQEFNELLRQFEKTSKKMKEIGKQIRMGMMPDMKGFGFDNF